MLDNEDCWKQIPPEVLGGVPSVPHGAVLGSTLDPVAEEKFLEKALKDKVTTLRKTETHLSTLWDPTLSYLLSPALANYELERVAGITFANEEFQSSIKNYVPEGHSFKAFPIQFNNMNVEHIALALAKSRTGYEVICTKGDEVRLGLRVKVVVYPENICAVWVMLASRFRAAH